MKVSVIIPVYNSLRYVEHCVEQLLQQSYQNLEVILVDDGSTDGSAAVCDRLQASDPRVRAVHQRNQGLSRARNQGLQLVTGDYFCFLDCDDWLDPEYFGACGRALEQKPVDILLTPYVYEYGKQSKPVALFPDQPNTWVRSGDETSWVLRRLFGQIGREFRFPARVENYNPVWSKLYRTDRFRKLAFVDTQLIGSEDLWYNINAFYQAQSYRYLDAVAYHYNRNNGSSITSSYRPGLADQYRTLYAMMAGFIRDHHLPTVYREALNNRKVANLITLSLNNYSSKNPQSIREQHQQMLKVLADPEWSTVWPTFNGQQVGAPYRLFFGLCRRRQVQLLGAMTKITMAIKRTRQERRVA